MFQVGDLVLLPAHGICEIDDVCDRTILGVTRKYYIMHPLEDIHLRISAPVDGDNVTALVTVSREQAENILESFRQPGVDWIDKSTLRNKEYLDLIKAGDRPTIARLVNTLLKRKYELEADNKKMSIQDIKLLEYAQSIVFTELALSLQTTVSDIAARVNRIIEDCMCQNN